MSEPDAATRLCGVIGHPVAHSLSPAIHNAALGHDGRNAVYLAFDVTDVGTALRGLAALGAVGVNVTVPHKREAWEAAAERSEGAERIGAANVIVFEGGTLSAHNTDAEGVVRGLGDLGVSPEAARCLVVGAGGSARAAVYGLVSAGAAEVTVVNRTDSRGKEVAEALDARFVAWDGLEEAVAAAEIVVHATTVGLEGERSFVRDDALARAASAGCRAVLDLVYGTVETDLVRRARAAGIASADGLGVLIHQAAATYRLFWGAEPPVPAMREAAAHGAGRPM